MSLVIYSIKDRVCYLTLNRPEKRNALNQELVAELTAAFDKAESDAEVKVVVLKAHGESFCAGADLAYLQQLQNFSFEQNLEDSRQLKNLYLKIYQLKKVVIAQVQGHALAGGCGLATVCDYFCSSGSQVWLHRSEDRIYSCISVGIPHSQNWRTQSQTPVAHRRNNQITRGVSKRTHQPGGEGRRS